MGPRDRARDHQVVKERRRILISTPTNQTLVAVQISPAKCVCPRAGARARVCVWGGGWKNGPSGSGEKGMVPAVQKTEVTSGPKYMACKPYGLGKRDTSF